MLRVGSGRTSTMPDRTWQATSAAGGNTARRKSSKNSATKVTADTKIVAGRPSRYRLALAFQTFWSSRFRLSKMEPAPSAPSCTVRSGGTLEAATDAGQCSAVAAPKANRRAKWTARSVRTYDCFQEVPTPVFSGANSPFIQQQRGAQVCSASSDACSTR